MNEGGVLTMQRQKKITAGQTVMSNILRISYLQGISDEWLANLLECSKDTLRARKKSPETLTLEEVNLFCEGTHTKLEDMIK